MKHRIRWDLQGVNLRAQGGTGGAIRCMHLRQQYITVDIVRDITRQPPETHDRHTYSTGDKCKDRPRSQTQAQQLLSISQHLHHRQRNIAHPHLPFPPPRVTSVSVLVRLKTASPIHVSHQAATKSSATTLFSIGRSIWSEDPNRSDRIGIGE